MAKDVRLILQGPRGSNPKRTLSIQWRAGLKIETQELCKLDAFEAAEVTRAGAVQLDPGGWIEDTLEPEDAPVEAPTGFVEVLSGDALADPPKRRKRRRRRGAKVKMGFASERLRKRAKGPRL